MFNTQSTGKRGLLAALLATVIISAAVLAGCGEESEAESTVATQDQAVRTTQISTKVESGILLDKNGQPVTDANGNYVKATQGTTAAKQNSQSSQSSQNKQTSKADSKQQSQASAANNNSNNQTSKANNNQQSSKSGGNSGNSSSGNTNRSPAPQNAATAPVEKKSESKSGASDLTIGNKHFKVGDTVTCTYYLKVPEKMLNFQGSAYFDPELLELTDAYLIAPANNGGMLNNNLKDHVSFNGSNLSGYDFVDQCYEFITVEYKVTGTGVTQPGIKFDVITGLSDKAYATDDGTLTGGAEIRESYE